MTKIVKVAFQNTCYSVEIYVIGSIGKRMFLPHICYLSEILAYSSNCRLKLLSKFDKHRCFERSSCFRYKSMFKIAQ